MNMDQHLDYTEFSVAKMSSVNLRAEVGKYANEILQVCSYHQRGTDSCVIRSRPHEMRPVQTSLQSAFEKLPTANLGILGRLPVELMLLTIHELDIRSFFHFRQVNRRARIISTGVREYKLVSRHGLEGLRGLLRAELAPYFTIHDLYRSLITDKCSTCGSFGGYLFLFTLERCCFNCLVHADHYRVLAPSTFARLVQIPLSRLDHLQKLHTVPGSYGAVKRPIRRPKHLILEDNAAQTLLAMTVIGEDAVRKLGRRRQQYQYFMAATAYPYYSVEDAKLEHGVCCKGCQIRYYRRYNIPLPQEPVFSSQGFLSHFSQCVDAQQHWAASERGSRPVDEPEIIRSCGLRISRPAATPNDLEAN